MAKAPAIITPTRRSRRVTKKINYDTSDIDSESEAEEAFEDEVEIDKHDELQDPKEQEDDNTNNKRKATTLESNKNENKKRKRKIDTGKSVKKGRSKKPVLEQENYLYQALSDPEIAIQELAIEWIESYEDDKDEALALLLNLMLRCCGCVHLLQSHDVRNIDLASSTVTEVQLAFESQKTHEYPFASTNKQIKFFHKNVLEFFDEILNICHEKGLLYNEEDSTQSELMTNVLTWLFTFSGSTTRPLRYVSTTIILNIQSKLCEIVGSILSHLERNQKQLKIRRNRNNRTMSLNVENYRIHVEIIKEYFNDIMESTFVHRYRDVDANIRSECIKHLGEWMISFPEYFLKSTNLRYFGWLLSDPSHIVRFEVVKMLHSFYKSGQDMSVGLRQFTERFKDQLINMALKDKDINVRLILISCLIEIEKIGLFTESEIVQISSQIFYFMSSNAPMIEKFKNEYAKFIQFHVNEVSKKLIDKYSVEGNKSGIDIYISIKSLVNFFDSTFSYYQTFSKKSLDIFAASELFISIYQLPNYAASWEDLVKYYLLDLSSLLTDDPELRDFLEIDDSQKFIILNLILGSLTNTITTKTKEISNDEDEAEFEPVLVKLTNMLPSIQKESIKYQKDFTVYLKTLTLLLKKTNSGNIYNAYKNLNQTTTFDLLVAKILEYYQTFKPDLRNDILIKVYEEFFYTLLNQVDGYSIVNASILDSEIRLNMQDIVNELIAESSHILQNQENLKSDFTNLFELSEDLAVPMLKLTKIGEFINVNEYLKKSNLLLNYLDSDSLVKCNIARFIKQSPTLVKNKLQSLTYAIQTILDFMLMSYSWKLEELMGISEPSIQTRYNIETTFSSINEETNKLLNIFKTSFISYNEDIDKTLWKLLNAFQTLIATKMIDLTLGFKLFHQKFANSNSFQQFDSFFTESGHFFVNHSESFESLLLNVYLYKEATLAKYLKANLDRNDEEDVNIDEMVEDLQLEKKPDHSNQTSRFDTEGDNRPNFESEASTFPETTNENEEKLWEAEKDLCVFTLKLYALINQNLLSRSFQNRLSLNSEKLGNLYSKVIESEL